MNIETCIPDPLPLRELDWSTLISPLGDAREALGRYDETLRKSPPVIFEIFKWQESISSLRGQNIDADLNEILRFSIEKSAEENRAPLLQKILNAQKGLQWAIKRGQNNPLNTQFLCRVHSIVKQDAPNPKEVGRFRKRQNWIGPQGCTIKGAYFFPPEAKKIRNYIHSLNRYMRTKEKDPLIQLAIFFAQFLIIHPFMDGNGRVARIFIPLFLWKKSLISQPLFFLSRYFESHRLDYFRKLFYISEKNQWENWIIYFLKGVIEQARRLKEEAEEIQELYQTLSAQIGEKAALQLFHQPLLLKVPSRLKKIVKDSSGLYSFEPLFKLAARNK